MQIFNSRNIQTILAYIALIMVVLSPFAPTKAQTAQDIIESLNDEENGIYGVNPFEGVEGEEGAEGEPQKGRRRDSLKVRERRPMESYFFDDEIRSRPNFKWSVDRNYNRVNMQKIDTTLFDWRIDYPYQKNGVGDMSLGGLGQASQPISFYDRERYYDFVFAEAFNAYIFDMENAPFYNTKKAFTIFAYGESGQKSYREANFQITHSQNINPSTNFTIDYRSNGTRGLYQRQDTKNHNLASTISHVGRRYSVHAGYLNNSIDTEESGGVVGTWAIRDSIFDMQIGIPVKLENAEASNKYRNNSIFVTQSYGIPLQPLTDRVFSMADISSVYIGHSFEYNTWSKVYSDTKATYTDDRAGIDEDGYYYSTTQYYYDDWFIDPYYSRDSIRERKVSNRLFVQAQPWSRNSIVSTLDGGVGLDFTTYNQFGLGDYLSGDLEKVNRTDWFAYGSAEGRFQRYLNWRGEMKIYPSGERAGDLDAKAEVKFTAYIRNRPISLSGDIRMVRQSPSYWDENLVSNHYIFDEPLETESDTRINIKFEIPALNFEIAARSSVLTDMIYYDADRYIAQSTDAISLSEIYLRKKFEFKGFNFDHRLLAQWSSDELVAPVPKFSAYLSYYYEFDVVKSVLRMQMGLDGRFTSRYYMPDYNPALSTFFNQRDSQIGGYPYIDAYVSAKWKRMRILVKYQHLNDGLFGNGEYFTVAGYPQNPGMFKLGFSWGFYD